MDKSFLFNAAPDGPNAVNRASVCRMSDAELLAYAASGPPASRPIKGTLADSSQKPLRVNEKVFVVSEDSDQRDGRLYHRRAHIVDSVSDDAVCFRPCDHKVPSGKILLPPRSDRVQRWSDGVAVAVAGMNAALARLRRLVPNRAAATNCDILDDGTTSRKRHKGVAEPVSEFAPAANDSPCVTDNVSDPPANQTGRDGRKPKSSRRVSSDAVLETASLLGYAFENSPPSQSGLSASSAILDSNACLLRRRGSSVSLEPSLNVSDSEPVVDLTHSFTPFTSAVHCEKRVLFDADDCNYLERDNLPTEHNRLCSQRDKSLTQFDPSNDRLSASPSDPISAQSRQSAPSVTQVAFCGPAFTGSKPQCPSREQMMMLSATELRTLAQTKGLSTAGSKRNLVDMLTVTLFEGEGLDRQPGMRYANDVEDSSSRSADNAGSGLEQERPCSPVSDNTETPSVESVMLCLDSGHAITRDQLSGLTIMQLRSICKQRNLTTRGFKADLVIRVLNSGALSRETLEDFSKGELQECCYARSLDASGKREDLITRLVESSDVQRNLALGNAAAAGLGSSEPSQQVAPLHYREQLEELTEAELQLLAKEHSLPESGSKIDLVRRLLLLNSENAEYFTIIELRKMCHEYSISPSGSKLAVFSRLAKALQDIRSQKDDVQVLGTCVSSSPETDVRIPDTKTPVSTLIEMTAEQAITREQLEELTLLEVREFGRFLEMPASRGLKADVIFRILCMLADRSRAAGSNLQLMAFSIDDLRAICNKEQLSSLGSKTVLVDRLMRAGERRSLMQQEAKNSEGASSGVRPLNHEPTAIRLDDLGDSSEKYTREDLELLNMSSLRKLCRSTGLAHVTRDVKTTLIALLLNTNIVKECSETVPYEVASANAFEVSNANGENVPSAAVDQPRCLLLTFPGISSLMEAMTQEQYEKMSTVDLELLVQEQLNRLAKLDLKAYAKYQGIAGHGSKADVVSRLMSYIMQPSFVPNDAFRELMMKRDSVESVPGRDGNTSRHVAPNEYDAAAISSAEHARQLQNVSATAIASEPTSGILHTAVSGDEAKEFSATVALPSPALMVSSDQLQAMSLVEVRAFCSAHGIATDKISKRALIRTVMNMIEESKHPSASTSERALPSLSVEHGETGQSSELLANNLLQKQNDAEFGKSCRAEDVNIDRSSDEAACELQVNLQAEMQASQQQQQQQHQQEEEEQQQYQQEEEQQQQHHHHHQQQQHQQQQQQTSLTFGSSTGTEQQKPDSERDTDLRASLTSQSLSLSNNASVKDDSAVQYNSRDDLLQLKVDHLRILARSRGIQRPKKDVRQSKEQLVDQVWASYRTCDVNGSETPAAVQAQPLVAQPSCSGSNLSTDKIIAASASSVSVSNSLETDRQLPQPGIAPSLDIPDASCDLLRDVADGDHPLPYLPSMMRLAKLCEHQRPRRLCLICMGLTKDDVQPPAELVSFPFHKSIVESVAKSSALKSVGYQSFKSPRDAEATMLSGFAPSVGAYGGAASSASEATAAELLKRQVQAAAQSAAAKRPKPSAPARIVCMALLHDKSRCRMPGVFPDDGDLWFCGMHKDKQKFGVIERPLNASDL